MKKKLLLASAALFLGASAAFAQKVVKGRVADANGDPVEGAVVRIPGTKVITYSDANGNFVIPSAPTSAKKVTISYVGMVSQTVDVSDNVNVKLESLNDLGEAVVMGYGSAQRLGTISGSVSSVSSKDLENKPVANIADALQGKVTGVSVYTSTGEPGATSTMTVRGAGSITGGTTPLYIVDGVMVSEGTVRSISPNDIESVSVLKDASATSIYGARAANGVVIYTTKKGRRGEAGRLSVDFMTGWSNMVSSKLVDNMMNSDELEALWRGYEEIGALRPGTVDRQLAAWAQANGREVRDFNWKDYVYRPNRKILEANLTYAGGSENTDYYVGFGIFDQDGLAYRSDYSRYSFKTNLNTALKPWLNAGVNVNVSYEAVRTNPDGENNLEGGLFYLNNPFYSPYDKDGKEYWGQLAPLWNSYTSGYRGDMFDYKTNTVHLTGSFYFELMPVKGLRIKTLNSLEGYDYTGSSKRSATHVGAPDNGSNSQSRERKYQWQTTNTAEYKFAFNDVHNFTALVGQEWMNYNLNFLDAAVVGIADDRLGELQSGTGEKTLSSGESHYTYLSYFGRLNYNYDNKYFGDVTLRNDRTSLLPEKTRSGWFFSLGARWKMKGENFLKDVSWVDRLDLRASYGTQGRTSIDPYEYYNLVGATRYNGNPAWQISTFGNDNLRWEKQKQFSVGAELAAFDHRLNATAEFYVKNNVDLLLPVPQPYTSGVSELVRNAGSIRNTGVELSLSYEVLRTQDWSVEPYLNIAYNKEKITKLFEEASDNGRYWGRTKTTTIWAVGKPRAFYIPVWAGVNKDTGAPQWYLPGDDPTKETRDPNRVTSTYSDALYQLIDDSKMAPDWIGGWGIRARWKGFSLNMDFSFQLNKTLMNNDAYFAKNPTVFLWNNTSKEMTNYWKQPGDDVKYPSLAYNATEIDTRILEDASFMRLKNITLSYDLPESLLSRTGFLTAARLYVTGRNLLTWTGYSGLDPEVNSNLTFGGHPNTRQVSLGVNLTF